jgi:methyl-accepting chemotaxis protein
LDAAAGRLAGAVEALEARFEEVLRQFREAEQVVADADARAEALEMAVRQARGALSEAIGEIKAALGPDGEA